MLSRDARYVAAAIQVIIAWEWLVSGADKLLAGTFPQGLAETLNDGIKGNPNGWYVAFLQQVILPHSASFGYAIEMTELLIGVVLLMGAVLLIGPTRRRDAPQYRLAFVEMSLVVAASLACALLCINFHFFMGDGVFPGIDTAKLFDEGISLDTLMPPLSLVILYINLAVLSDMTGIPLSARLRRAGQRVAGWFGHAQQAPNAGNA